MYFDQLLGAVRTQKLVETFISVCLAVYKNPELYYWTLFQGGGGVELLNAIEETYSNVQKGMKENQERTNGDY